jgi:hypothetical protein
LFDVDLVNIPKEIPNFIEINEKLLKEEDIYYKEQTKKYGNGSLSDPEFLETLIENQKETEAFKIYLFCREGPLISSRSKFSKKSIVKQDL